MPGQAVMSDELIAATIPKYRWFAHVPFGNGLMAQSTAWPDAPLHSPHMGVAKFEFIVRRNLPDLQGKRVLDLGCNAGLIAIHMARLGAIEVVGIDTETSWPQWREQAEFVRAAFEWRCRAKYNVRYIEANIRDVPSLDLGRFDVVTALNCLYYLAEPDIARVARHVSTIADVFLVQCNTRDQKQLGRLPTPAYMRRVLNANGFARTWIDAPWDRPRRGVVPQRYCRPVVVGCVKTEERPTCG